MTDILILLTNLFVVYFIASFIFFGTARVLWNLADARSSE